MSHFFLMPKFLKSLKKVIKPGRVLLFMGVQKRIFNKIELIYPVLFSHIFFTFLLYPITQINLISFIKQLQPSLPVILSLISS